MSQAFKYYSWKAMYAVLVKLSHTRLSPSKDKVLKRSQWIVNLEMVDNPGGIVLLGEVGFICPVSGG
jgi:hypothetical protein